MYNRQTLFELKKDLCRLLVEKASDGIFIVGKDRFEYCNQSFVQFCGISETEFASDSAQKIIETIVHPDDREEIKKWWCELTKNSDNSVLGPVRVNNREGRTGHLQLSSTDGQEQKIIGVIRDISELVESQSRLLEKERILSSLIEQARTPVFIVQNGVIKYANPAVLETFGYCPEEVIETRIDEYLSEDRKEDIMSLYGQRHSDPNVSQKLECTLLHKNGQKIEVDVEFNFIEYQGQSAEIVLAHDITERKRIESRLEEALEKLRKAFGATIRVLNKIVEIKDPYTGGHQKRVAELARTIATEMGLTPEQIDGLRLAAQIHDIGKIIVPSEILNKPGILSESEWGLVKNHAAIGYELLKDMNFPWPVAEIVYQHHERMDGSGYPRGLKGEQIMIEARIMAVADVVEAMSSFRPYRESHALEDALSEIEVNRGRLYDPRVVEVCLDLFRKKGFRLNNCSFK